MCGTPFPSAPPPLRTPPASTISRFSIAHMRIALSAHLQQHQCKGGLSTQWAVEAVHQHVVVRASVSRVFRNGVVERWGMWKGGVGAHGWGHAAFTKARATDHRYTSIFSCSVSTRILQTGLSTPTPPLPAGVVDRRMRPALAFPRSHTAWGSLPFLPPCKSSSDNFPVNLSRVTARGRPQPTDFFGTKPLT